MKFSISQDSRDRRIRLRNVTLLCLAILWSSLLIPGPHLLAESPAEEGSYSFRLILKDPEHPERRPKGSIALYRLATASLDAGKLTYTANEPFADLAEDFGQVQDLALAEKAARLAQKAKPYKILEVSDTEVEVAALPPGLYLIMRAVETEGNFRMRAFIISLPEKSEEAVDGWLWRIVAEPKLDIEDANVPWEPPTPPTSPKSGTPEQPVPTGDRLVPPSEKVQPPDKVQPPEKLPQTAMLRWPVPVLVLAGLICFGFGLVLRKG